MSFCGCAEKTAKTPTPAVPAVVPMTRSAESTPETKSEAPAVPIGPLREKTVAYAREMAQIGWHTDTEIDFSYAKSWTPNLRYFPNISYRGLPYTSDRISANGNLNEFAACVDGQGLYTGESSYNELPGTDCGGVVRLAYARAGVLCGQELETMVFDPNSGEKNCGLVPLGGYDVSGYSRASNTKKEICDKNGMQTVLSCYAMLQPGDCLFTLFDGGGEHIALITDLPKTETGASGQFLPEKCSVCILEQNADVHEFDGWCSNWYEHELSFAEMYEYGYIPYTMEQFSQTEQEPVGYQTDFTLPDTASFHDLMVGQVRCNYNMFTLSAVISDENGQTVCEGVSYPNSLIADLCELSYAEQLLALPSGSYRLTLRAQTGFGDETILDTEFTYEQPNGLPTVYISDDGTGSGQSAQTALGNAEGYYDMTQMSYQRSAFYRAVTMLSKTGGTVVICGDVSLISGRALERYTGEATCFSAPSLSSKKQLVLTSCDGTTDFRAQNGAELILRRTAQQAVDLELCIGTVWRDIDLTLDYDFPEELPEGKWSFVSCGNAVTVFENTANVVLKQCGEPLDPVQHRMLLPNLYGGYFYGGTQASTDLTVNGGTWGCVIGGSGCCILIGESRLTVGQNAVILNGVYGGGDDPNEGGTGGDVYVTINGGTIAGDLYVSGTSDYVCDGCRCLWTVSGAPDLTGVENILPGTLPTQQLSLELTDAQNADILRNSEIFGTVTEP